MAERRFYWLKLKDDFFKNKAIKKLRKIAGGDTYTIIYLKMLLSSIKNEGLIVYEGVEPTLEEEIALDIDEEIENVKVTVAFLFSNGLLLETDKVNEFALPESINNIDSESAAAERMRNMRKRNNVTPMLQSVTQALRTSYVDIDKEKEKDIEKNNICSPEGSQGVVLDEKETMFEEFWKLYPKKSAKAKCKVSFMRIKNLKEEFSKIKEHLNYSKTTDQWTKSNGQYIPSPLTYINQERWKDIIEIPKSETKQMFDDISLDGWDINARL